MDVMRGDPCVDAPTRRPPPAITAYDWCVNGTDGRCPQGRVPPAGHAPATSTHCTDHSREYYVRVYRKPGATATCTPYDHR